MYSENIQYVDSSHPERQQGCSGHYWHFVAQVQQAPDTYAEVVQYNALTLPGRNWKTPQRGEANLACVPAARNRID